MTAVVSNQEASLDTTKVDGVSKIKIADIVVPQDRARNVDESWVEALAGAIEHQGLINAITVRAQGDKYVLVTGFHRLEAVKKLGHEAIVARMSNALTDDDAKLEEVMENLARKELNALKVKN